MGFSMNDTASTLVIFHYCHSHERILAFLETLSDRELRWRLNATTHSIAFHAWHIARWADYFQACVPAMTAELSKRLPPGEEIWLKEGLSKQWQFSSAQLGYADTGMQMPDEAAMDLPFPAKPILLDYIRMAFAAAEGAARAIDDEQLLSAEQPQPKTEGVWGEATVGDAVMTHIIHDSRHRGMIECLLGLQGRPGTSTA